MNKKRSRVPTGMHEPLRDSPFAALAGERVPDSSPAAAPPNGESADSPAPLPYRMSRTRQGGWPLRVEKRPGDRKVTVLEGVEGDARVLLRALQRHCGAGGNVSGVTIELQGDRRAAVVAYLDGLFPPRRR